MVPCPICSGKRPYCIHKSYPIERSKEIEKRVKEKLKKDFFGPSYSVFVGHFGYPQVNVGPLAGLEEAQNIDNPASWFGMGYQQIIELRSMLIRSKQPESVFSRDRFVQENQELALASKPTDVELLFKKEPVYKFVLSDYLQPMGPVGSLEKLKITENTKIEKNVEYIVRDDLKAAQAVGLLYQNKQDVYKITTILSSGILGKQDNRKLVPTRWSIVASIDIIAKKLIEQIKDYPILNEYRVYHSDYLDNHYTILLIPGSWEFENFETWAPGSNWSIPTQSKVIEEYEPFEGRTKYAEIQAGGFYQSRFGCCELLESLKRQAKVVVFREVGEGYSIPVGSWQILESIRHAGKQSYRKFSTEKEVLDYLKTKLKIGVDDYIKTSKILKRKTLLSFIK